MKPEMSAFRHDVFEGLNKTWTALGASDGVRANAMTAGWGGTGVLWEKPVFFVPVRKSRYTYSILEKTDTLTLSFFGDGYRKELTYLGRTSGRDEDKLKNCGLTAVLDGKNVYFQEAEYVLCGRILAKTDLEKDLVLDEKALDFYKSGDWHRIYICEASHAFSPQKDNK